MEEIEKTALQVRAERAEAALAQMQVLAIGGEQALGAQWQAEAAHANEQFRQALQYKPSQEAVQQQLALQPAAQVNAVLPTPALSFRQQLQQELAAMGVNTIGQGSPQVGQQQPQVQQQLQPAAPLTEVQALQQQVEQLMQAQQQGQGGYNSRNNGGNRGGGGGGGGGYNNNRRNNGGGNFNRQNQNSGSRGACFECGSTDHQVARCPQRQQRNQQQFGQQQFGQQRQFVQQQQPMQQFVYGQQQQQPVQQLVQQQPQQMVQQMQQPRQPLPVQQVQVPPQTINYIDNFGTCFEDTVGVNSDTPLSLQACNSSSSLCALRSCRRATTPVSGSSASSGDATLEVHVGQGTVGDTPRSAYPNPDPDPILDYRLEPALDRMLEPVGDDRMLEPACMPCIDQSCTSWTTCNYPECNRVVRM